MVWVDDGAPEPDQRAKDGAVEHSAARVAELTRFHALSDGDLEEMIAKYEIETYEVAQPAAEAAEQEVRDMEDLVIEIQAANPAMVLAQDLPDMLDELSEARERWLELRVVAEICLDTYQDLVAVQQIREQME